MPIWAQRLLFVLVTAGVGIFALAVGGHDHVAEIVPWAVGGTAASTFFVSFIK